MKYLSVVAALLLLAGTVMAGEYPDISIAELKKAIASGKVTLLDVNGTTTYEKNHIPTATDYTANAENLAKILPKDKNALVVAYCGGPKCMAYKKAADAAEKLGYKNIKHLTAGISGWISAGEKTGNVKSKGNS